MRVAGAVAVAGLVCLGALTAATQYVAGVFDHQRALGAPLFRSDHGEAFYWPWSVLAWSERWSDQYPRPFAIAHLLLLAGGVSAVAIAIIITRGAAPRLRRHGESGWATFADAHAAGLFATSGAVLGKLDGELLAYDGPGHLLLIGASRSGKGRGHVVPTLLAWPKSTIVLDVKGELADGDTRLGFPGTAGFRETLGPVLRFAPTREGQARFNPLFEVRKGVNEVRDVQNIVEIIVDPAGDGRHEDFWDRSARQVITGVILHVLYAEPEHRKTLAIVREKLRDLDAQAQLMRVTLHRVGPDTGQPEVHPEVLHAAESYLAGEERMRSGVKATAESFFGIFADPLIARNTAASDFRIGDLVCGERPVSLYLQPPPSDAARLMPLMRLVLNQVSRALMEDQERDATGREKRHDLLLLLDEFPQLGRLAFFETAMGAFAGYGLKAYLVCQSLNHVTRAYGRDSVIIDNCHVVTAFGAADVETAKTIAAMAGERWEVVEQASLARPPALIASRRGSTTFREERRPLMLNGDVRQLPNDEQIIFVAGAKPLRAKKIKFDQERVFAQRVRASAQAPLAITTGHDWQGVRALGQIAKVEKTPRRLAPALAKSETTRVQGDLFPEMSISERALAGFRNPPPADAARTSGV